MGVKNLVRGVTDWEERSTEDFSFFEQVKDDETGPRLRCEFCHEVFGDTWEEMADHYRSEHIFFYLYLTDEWDPYIL